MKIIRLEAYNFMGLLAVEITPHGAPIVVITGKNGAGKSAVLHLIRVILEGAKGEPDVPIRLGQEEYDITAELGDHETQLVISCRRNLRGKFELTIKDKGGRPFRSPQDFLDRLRKAKTAYEPLDFVTLRPNESKQDLNRRQAETLRGLVGLDVSGLDSEAAQVTEDRTQLNRQVKALEARLSAMPIVEAPDQEQSLAGIMDEQAAAAERNAENERVRQHFRNLREACVRALTARSDAQAKINDLLAQLENWNKVLADRKGQVDTARKAADAAEERALAVEDVDLTPFRERAAKVEETNRAVRQKQERWRTQTQLKFDSEAADKLTARLDAIAAEKRKLTAAAKWPVPGLGFSDSGTVTLDGVPLSQASSAQQLRAAVAIGMALNPELRLMTIRNGNDLDENSMKLLRKLVQDADGQVWIECVKTDDPGAIVIKDGRVAENPDKE